MYLDGVEKVTKILFYITCVTIPLAALKVIDIIIWLTQHLSIVIK